jgi:YD repeat-containing protein
VNEMVHEYEAINKVNIRGVARGPITRLILPNAYGCLACSIPLDRYAIFSYLIRAIASTERQYDVLDEARFLQSTTSYIYETGTPVHMQISGTQTLCSDGSTIVKRMTYPADYTSVTTGPLAQMRSDAMYQHSAVVESITQVYGPNESPAQAKTISGTYTEYAQPAPTGKYLPVVQRALELPEPTPNLTVAAPSLPPLGRYVDKVYLSYYPASANLQQAQIVHDVPTSYVWGYQNTLPIAKIENASASQVQAALTAMNVDPNTVNIDADLRSAFAQLRARLPMARVTGMTYAPLVGMTSQTDANGRSFFYEYDALGRLLRTRDEQNRILTQTEYHYARP